MGDLVYIGILIGFFGLAVQLVRGCERIVGPDENAASPAKVEPEPDAELAA